MIIFKNPNIDDLYLFHFGEKVVKVNFLLRQIAYFKRDSPFFDTIFLNDWIEETEMSDLTMINRAKLLLRHLQIEMSDNVEVFSSTDDSSCFLLKQKEKVIQVDTKFKSLSDESDSLFLQNTYKLGKPETKNRTPINIYKKIFQNHDECINSLRIHRTSFC